MHTRSPLSRRSFLRASLATTCLTTFASTVGLRARAEKRASGRPLRAAIIGHTGRGDYGHGYDRLFADLPAVAVVALADPDEQGRRQAVVRSGAARAYADYRPMLEREKPDLVAIAMRQPRPHREIALAAMNSGAHLFMEKPFTETLQGADDVAATAGRLQRHVVVAHNRRYAPEFQQLKSLVDEGFLGEVREVRMQGKQDARAGGEDLVVLGTHDFDLLRFLFGDPAWCMAHVALQGREVRPSDARDGREPIRVAGDAIRILFGFGASVAVTWSSVTRADGWNRPSGPRENWAFEILGTRRILAYQSGTPIRYLDSPFFLPPDSGESRWLPLPQPAHPRFEPHQRHFARDLVHAVESGAPTLCGAEDGRWTIEMVTAVYQSHLRQSRVRFPLDDRRDPLAP